MADIMVRNVPMNVCDFLKRSAKVHGRSVNAEAVAVLSDEDSWAVRRLEINSVISELRPLRQLIQKNNPTLRLASS